MGASARRKEERAKRFKHSQKHNEGASTLSKKSSDRPVEPEAGLPTQHDMDDSFEGISSSDEQPAREETSGRSNTAIKRVSSPRFIAFVGTDRKNSCLPCPCCSGFRVALAGCAAVNSSSCLTPSFAGNLPFSATEASIKRHFASTRPKAIRLRTNKETGRCRGFAFLEYESRAAQQACLLDFHHTHFRDADDREVPEHSTTEQPRNREDRGDGAGSVQKGEQRGGKGWRRINVELT